MVSRIVLVYRDHAVLIWIIVVGVILRLIYFHGIGSADDLSIGSAAMRVLEDGPYLPTGHYAARIGMIYPLAGLFAIAGIGEWQMALIPMLSSICCMLLAYLIARRIVDKTAAIWAAAALAVFPLDVTNATRFIPDLYLGAVLAGAVYFALAARQDDNNQVIKALVAGLLWGWAYLIKIEAAFLVFPIFFLYLHGERRWRELLVTCAGCALFVAGENIFYWLQTGTFLYRLQIITGGGIHTLEYSARQLWVFPKAWFATPYYFALHYYALFISLAVVFVKREKNLYLVVIWLVVYLIWLQFGFNPLGNKIGIKSHLARYCLMVNVPAAVLIGYGVARLFEIGRKRISWITIGGWLAISLFFINFNLLGNEREIASKRAIRIIQDNRLYPAYMDSGTYSIAEFLLYGSSDLDRIESFQRHNFKTAETDLTPVDRMDGYLVINRGFVEYRRNRYLMQGYDIDDMVGVYPLVATIDNPLPSIAYMQLRFLGFVARLMPFPFLREKIHKTVNATLRVRDVAIFDVTKPAPTP